MYYVSYISREVESWKPLYRLREIISSNLYKQKDLLWYAGCSVGWTRLPSYFWWWALEWTWVKPFLGSGLIKLCRSGTSFKRIRERLEIIKKTCEIQTKSNWKRQLGLLQHVTVISWSFTYPFNNLEYSTLLDCYTFNDINVLFSIFNSFKNSFFSLEKKNPNMGRELSRRDMKFVSSLCSMQNQPWWWRRRMEDGAV